MVGNHSDNSRQAVMKVMVVMTMVKMMMVMMMMVMMRMMMMMTNLKCGSYIAFIWWVIVLKIHVR